METLRKVIVLEITFVTSHKNKGIYFHKQLLYHNIKVFNKILERIRHGNILIQFVHVFSLCYMNSRAYSELYTNVMYILNKNILRGKQRCNWCRLQKGKCAFASQGSYKKETLLCYLYDQQELGTYTALRLLNLVSIILFLSFFPYLPTSRWLAAYRRKELRIKLSVLTHTFKRNLLRIALTRFLSWKSNAEFQEFVRFI